jgi:hypothetical protein
VKYQGLVLDGRHRLRVCLELGLPLKTEDLPPDTDPVEYVVAINRESRHLKPSQLAIVGAKIADLEIGANQYREGPSGDGPSREEAAKMLKVSTASIDRTREVLKDGAPEVG